MSELIPTAVPKGFRDLLPDVMQVREHFIAIAQQVYRSYSFVPIETPALEYSRVLLGKGGEESDKQLFRFTDAGKRDVAMRFDLTVPFARFAAKHIPQLGTPFKRYHIGTVWRGESPQAGRFREFMQCDFDTIGTESNVADIETLLVIHDLFTALGFEKFKIRVNNRLVLNGLLETLNLTEQTTGVLRALDKLPKIGREAVIEEMKTQVGTTQEAAEQVLLLTETEGTAAEILDQIAPLLENSEQGKLGIANLRQLFAVTAQSGVDLSRVQLDLTIARGLDYYTGTIYETFLDDLPEIGSVCSGGRYDNLAQLYTKQKLPGVGASLGLDRLLAAMEKLGQLEGAKRTTPVLITQFDADRVGDYLKLGRQLRSVGIDCDVYPEARPLKKQLKFANERNFRLAIIAGSREFDEGVWQLKDLAKGEQASIADDRIVTEVQSRLAE